MNVRNKYGKLKITRCRHLALPAIIGNCDQVFSRS